MLACALPAAAQEKPREGAPRIVLYFNESGPRIDAALEKLRKAVERADWSGRHVATIRHVVVDPSAFRGASVKRSQGETRVTVPPDLVERIRESLDPPPAAILATSALMAVAAQRATTQVPILFASHQDPVALGIVASMGRPGSNATGFTFYSPIEAKRLELLTTLKPSIRRLGVIANQWWDDDPGSQRFEEVARNQFGLETVRIPAENVDQLRTGVASPAAKNLDAWFVPGEPAFQDPAGVAAAINATGKPAIYAMGLVAAHGGLMSYQAVPDDPFALWAKLLGMVLDGIPPSEIPVASPKVFELHVNTRTARQQGITIPRSVLLRASVVH